MPGPEATAFPAWPRELLHQGDKEGEAMRGQKGVLAVWRARELEVTSSYRAQPAGWGARSSSGWGMGWGTGAGPEPQGIL